MRNMKLLNELTLKRILKSIKGKHYTYCIHRNNGEMYYVGVGKNDRVFTHSRERYSPTSKNKLKNNITSKEIDLGGIYYSLALVHQNRQMCLDREVEMIAYFGRADLKSGILSNLTDGGEGIPTNYRPSAETLAKQAISREINKPIIAEKALKRWATKTKEERQTLCAHLDLVKKTDKYREAVSKGKKDEWHNKTEEAKTAVLTHLYEIRSTPIAEENQRAAMKELWADPLFRERFSAAHTLRHSCPVYLEKVRQTQQKAQLNISDKRSSQTTAFWADADNKARVIAARLKTLEGKTEDERAAIFQRRSDAQKRRFANKRESLLEVVTPKPDC